MKLPKKYLTKNPRVMRREIEKHKDKADTILQLMARGMLITSLGKLARESQ